MDSSSLPVSILITSRAIKVTTEIKIIYIIYIQFRFSQYDISFQLMKNLIHRPPPPKTQFTLIKNFYNKLAFELIGYHPKNWELFWWQISVVDYSQVASIAHPMMVIITSRHQCIGSVPANIISIFTKFFLSLQQRRCWASTIPADCIFHFVQLHNYNRFDSCIDEFLFDVNTHTGCWLVTETWQNPWNGILPCEFRRSFYGSPYGGSINRYNSSFWDCVTKD